MLEGFYVELVKPVPDAKTLIAISPMLDPLDTTISDVIYRQWSVRSGQEYRQGMSPSMSGGPVRHHKLNAYRPETTNRRFLRFLDTLSITKLDRAKPQPWIAPK